MTLIEAQKSAQRWRRWAASVRSRWQPDSPMAALAARLEQEAEQRLIDLAASEQGEGS